VSVEYDEASMEENPSSLLQPEELALEEAGLSISSALLAGDKNTAAPLPRQCAWNCILPGGLKLLLQQTQQIEYLFRD